ncbi:MAG: hypothetical protein R2912_04075, partial [Eubacteriales bacterium]
MAQPAKSNKRVFLLQSSPGNRAVFLQKNAPVFTEAWVLEKLDLDFCFRCFFSYKLLEFNHIDLVKTIFVDYVEQLQTDHKKVQ